jgi:hypothetical protein
MPTTFYKDAPKPKPLKKKLGRIACVITTHFSDEMRLNYPLFDQNLEFIGSYIDNKLDNFKFCIKAHESFKPGMDYDLIIVDNSSTNKQGLDYLESLPYKVYTRENEGFSFGGYKWAIENLDYDYYVFHEQDVCPSHDGWLTQIWEAYQKPGIGAVGNVIEKRELKDAEEYPIIREQFKALQSNRKYLYNFDGTLYFIPQEVAEQTTMRVLNGKIDTSTYNEILFIQPVLELGYKIYGFGNQDHKLSKVHFTYGSRKAISGVYIKESQIAPLVDTITRITSPSFKKYFNERGLL